MDEQLKQRLVGAAVLVLLAVIFIPMILDQPPEPAPRVVDTPVMPKSDQSFSSRIIPLDQPKTPMIEARRSRMESAEPAAEAQEAEPKESATTPPDAEKEQPAPDAQSGENATTAGAAAGPTAWAVQLGSFSSAQNAVALRDRLRKKGYTAFVEKAQSHGSEVTRVFVGPALAKEQADEVVKKLYAETKLKGIVVRYPGS
ncbi:MAG: SPOR domain-containing protein [Gammaproteobacteria bacterium]|nr:SPOR domain-containing protein [Gammaproteobacteria bacterium]